MPALGSSSGKSAAAEKTISKKKVRVRAPKPPAPTRTQIRSSRAQQNQYVSQGKAVKKVARQQTKVRVARERATAPNIRRAGEDKSDANRAKAENYVRSQYVAKGDLKHYKQGTTVLPREAAIQRIKIKGPDGKVKFAHSQLEAPVLKALDQTTRTLHASAAGARAAIKGKGIGGIAKAELKGIQNKDRSTYSDVAGDLGVHNKTLKGVLGYAGDLAFDPATYATGGAGSIARKAAEKEAARVSAKSLTKGLTKDQADRMGQRAAAKTLRTADQTKGVVIRYGGKEIPGVRKATAKASKPVRAVARKVAPQKARNTARSVAVDVNPDATPVGTSKETSKAAVQATRTARGRANQGTRRAVNVGHGIRQQIGETNYHAVVDAIEAKDIKRLPEKLRPHAIALRSESRHVRRVQRQAGVAVANAERRRKVVVPKVTADVHGAQEKLRETLTHRANIERKPKRLSKVPTREEFIKNRPKASRLSDEPTVERLTRNIKPGKPGYAIEAEHVSMVDPLTKQHVEWGRELPGSKVIVRRDQHGKVIGAVRILHDVSGKPDILEVAVDPKYRGKGVASRLYAYAQKHGYDVEGASGKGGYTEAGAAFAHKRLVKRAGKQDSVSAQALRRARADAQQAERDLTHTRTLERRQKLSQSKAAKLKAQEADLARGYVPRQTTKEHDEAVGHSGKASVIKPGSSKARVEKRRMSVVRVEKPGVYREDLHAVMAERVATGHGAAAKATLAQDLARLGRPVKPGKSNAIDKETEAVFHVSAGKALREVTDPKEIDRALKPLELNKKGSKVKGATPKKLGGRYVVLNKDLVERSVESANPALKGPGIVHTLDKATSGFKRLAIATPGFHVRNLAGDLQNAYLGQPAHHLPANMRRAAKVLKAHGAGEKAIRQLKPSEVGNATLKTEKYGNVTYDEVAKNLAQHGAFGSGYIAGELRELSASGAKSTGRIATTVRKGRQKVGQTRPAQAAKNAALAREDLPRLTTAMEALRKGATWEQASQAVAGLHFDYQHLTNFERQIARRAAPFYTWSARNIPLQARKFVTQPGKYAHYQALREEATKTSGVDQVDPDTQKMYQQLQKGGVKMPGGWEKFLSEWEQRNAGVPLKLGGQKFTVSSGLPLGDLNELPGAALGHQLDEYYQKGMSLTGPIPKDLVEFFENHSFFFRDQLERDNSPLVAAPAWAKALPKPVQKLTGLTPDYIDKKTGKKELGWKGKADYVFSAVPGTPNYIKQLSTGGTDRRGKGTAGKVLSYLGVKTVPVDPVKNAVNLAYARLDEIAKAKAALNQQGIKATNATPAYRKLLDQEKLLKQIAYSGKSAQGYKILPAQGGPSKGSSSGFQFNQSTGGFKFN